MDKHPLWLLREDVGTFHQLSTAIGFDASNKVRNEQSLERALTELLYTRPLIERGDRELPDGFIQPEVWLPPLDFEPDYFELNHMMFVSQRFRDALAQPDNVVQYWPIHLARGSEKARAQDYKLLRILAWQPALDWEHSVCERVEITNRRTGERLVRARHIERFVPSADLMPRTEIFRAAEDPVSVLVVDGLAERVLRAGCTGVSFREPETVGLLGREPRRFRTADGIGIEQGEVGRASA